MRGIRTSVLALATLASLLLLAPNVWAADNYDIDASHSWIGFKVKHMGVGTAHGRFNKFAGSYTYDAKNPTASSVQIVIEAGSVDSAHPKRDAHLRNPDFFNAKLFPKISFKSTKVKGTAAKATVTGTLTLLGKTGTVTGTLVKVGEGKDPWGNYRSGFDATFTFKRSNFGMNYQLTGIGDEVTVSISIEGIRK